MSSPKQKFIQQLEKTFPNLLQADLENLISENLISHFAIELSPQIVQQAQDFIADISALRESKNYLDHFQDLIQAKGLQDPGNKSMVMSYDFHVDENNDLKLIEVNTNAAFLILGHQMYLSKNVPFPISDFSLDEIAQMVLEELRLQGKEIKNPSIVITDENPKEQKLYFEFLAYQELYRSYGWKAEILDFKEIFEKANPDFIYNRHTDFFLSEPESQVFRQKYLSQEVCVSPNPFEYLLLADKQRMMDWRQPGFLEKMEVSAEAQERILAVVPTSLDLDSQNAAAIWADKKKFFVKPKNAFGSKQSYRAGSMSRKLFDSLVDQDLIAQEYVPAGEQEFVTPEGPVKFKYDLRCYAYKGRLQTIIARIYQGQVTNLKTPYGGFAPVLITST